MSENVGKGFSLVMELADPARLGELMAKLDDPLVKPRIQAALASLDYVHYARFLPLWEHGLLLIVTEFDGAMHDYVMDFAAVLDDEFSLILSYMKGQPPLPVSRHPDKFWEYVDRNTGFKQPHPMAYPEPFCAYPGVTALEIAGAARTKLLPAPKPPETEPDPKQWLHDVQAHTLRSYKATLGWHLGFEFAGVEQGRKMLAALSSLLSNSGSDPRGEKLCITLGLTHAGLQALGLPQPMLEQFPVAFREGPRLRSERLGDRGPSDPKNWKVAGYDKRGHPVVVHGMVSVYTNEGRKTLDEGMRQVRAAIGDLARECFEQDAQAIGDQGEIHFGYRDGIGQPRFTATEPAGTASGRPITPTGDLLLGPRYRNSRGGYYIGELPPALALNGTYAAVRIIEQKVKAFEQMLDDAEQQLRIDRELVAAKLVGRWRDGSPLTLYPAKARSSGAPTPAELLDAFDYTGHDYPLEAAQLKATGDAPAPGIEDDEGRRCPFGAHVRRLNPRDGMALGVPWGRRVVRRGMPYGPKFDRKKPSAHPRGLVGLFLCGDLESQFEFIQHVWANHDLSAPGLRDTQDVFGSAHKIGTPFRFRPKESDAEASIMVPPLTTTIGSLYLFMPGLEAVKWLGQEGWVAAPARSKSKSTTPATGDTTMDIKHFDPTSPLFNADPYAYYAAFRRQQAVSLIGRPYNTRWVFSRKLVEEVCDKEKTVFLKPGKNRAGEGQRPFSLMSVFGDGLFFMDPKRHGEVREVMEGVFRQAIEEAPKQARKVADRLLGAAKATGQLEVIAGYAGPLASEVFFQIMGVAGGSESFVVDHWIREALRSHDKSLRDDQRMAGGTATMALRTYLLALGREVAKGGHGVPTIMAGIQNAVGAGLTQDEATNTALNMALGGYLSTEFLIGSGLHNLLRDPSQWQLLARGEATVDQAVHEMLRFDAPFQMADRYVEHETTLGDFKLEAGKMFTIVYGSANRDLPDSEEPDRFNIQRDPKVKNFGFGDGIHYCIGAPLATIVARTAVEALLETFPGARIGQVGGWGTDPYFRTLSSLQLLLR